MRNKINYFLVNLCLVFIIIILIYLSRNIWFSVFKILKKICSPFIYAFFIAYFLRPIVLFFKKNLFLLFIFIFSLIIFCIIIFPILSIQIVNMGNYLVDVITYYSSKYNFDLSNFEIYIYDFIKLFGGSIFSIVLKLFDSIFNIFIILSISVYFIIDMDKIYNFILSFFSNTKFYDVLIISNNEMRSYFNSYFKIMFISFFEYFILYKLIGHPYSLLLAFLMSICSIIPVIGNMSVNVLASISSFFFGTGLFIKTLVLIFILSIIDSYVINPIVFGKSSNIHPIIFILAFLIGSMGGVIGIIISFPLIVIIFKIIKLYGINFVNYFKV